MSLKDIERNECLIQFTGVGFFTQRDLEEIMIMAEMQTDRHRKWRDKQVKIYSPDSVIRGYFNANGDLEIN